MRTGVFITMVSAGLAATVTAPLRGPLGRPRGYGAIQDVVYPLCDPAKTATPLHWDTCDGLMRLYRKFSNATARPAALDGDNSELDNLEKSWLASMPAADLKIFLDYADNARNVGTAWYISPSVGLEVLQYDVGAKRLRVGSPTVGFGVRYAPTDGPHVFSGSTFGVDLRFSIGEATDALDLQGGVVISILDLVAVGYLPFLRAPTDGDGEVEAHHVLGFGLQRGF